jgi:hypothetical protein
MQYQNKIHTVTLILVILAATLIAGSASQKMGMDVLADYKPTGWMGDLKDINLTVASSDSPHSLPICTKIVYSPKGNNGWAGIYWQYPANNWGDNSKGYDLTGAKKLTFWARGQVGGERAEFKVGGITGQYPDSMTNPISTDTVVLSNEWQQYTIDLIGQDLSHVIGGFCWVTNINQNPMGCIVYLDDIIYES